MVLADMVGRHVQWAQLYLTVGESGRIQTEWLTRSLEEVMFQHFNYASDEVPQYLASEIAPVVAGF